MPRCQQTSSTAPNHCSIRSSTAVDVRRYCSPPCATIATPIDTALACSLTRSAHACSNRALAPSSARRRLLCVVPQAKHRGRIAPCLPAACDGCVGSGCTEDGSPLRVAAGGWRRVCC